MKSQETPGITAADFFSELGKSGPVYICTMEHLKTLREDSSLKVTEARVDTADQGTILYAEIRVVGKEDIFYMKVESDTPRDDQIPGVQKGARDKCINIRV
jgi:hypothetical protein